MQRRSDSATFRDVCDSGRRFLAFLALNLTLLEGARNIEGQETQQTDLLYLVLNYYHTRRGCC